MGGRVKLVEGVKPVAADLPLADWVKDLLNAAYGKGYDDGNDEGYDRGYAAGEYDYASLHYEEEDDDA